MEESYGLSCQPRLHQGGACCLTGVTPAGTTTGKSGWMEQRGSYAALQAPGADTASPAGRAGVLKALSIVASVATWPQRWAM